MTTRTVTASPLPSAPAAPRPAATTPRVTVRPGDTLSSISRAHGLSLEQVVKANPKIRDPDALRPGQVVRLPSPDNGPRQITIQPGDTLASIARAHGLSIEDTLKANPSIEDPNLIRAGATLVLPPPSSATTSSAPRPAAVERTRVEADVQQKSRGRAVADESRAAARVLGGTGRTATSASTGPATPSSAAQTAQTAPGPGTPLPAVAQRPAQLTTSRHTVTTRLRYSDNTVSAAQRAGYLGAAEHTATYRPTVVRDERGQTKTLALLEHRNARNVWSDERGTELYLSAPTREKGPGGKEIEVRTILNQHAARSDAAIMETRIPAGSTVVPSLGKDARERIAELERKGFVVEGVLGTGFIDSKNKKIVGYHYVNEARLQGRDAPADAGTRNDGLGSGKIHAGYRVTRDGQMKLLDFAGMPRDQVRAALKALESDPDTAAINLFAHTAASRPEDLVGVIGATKGKTPFGKARSAMIFDARGDFVGHLRMPPVSLLDTVTLAKQVYGDRAARVLNQDGDFYAQNWFADGREGSADRALGFDNAMLVVRRARPGESVKTAEPQHPIQRGLDEARYWFDENVVDNAKDAIDGARAAAGGLIQRLFGNDRAE